MIEMINAVSFINKIDNINYYIMNGFSKNSLKTPLNHGIL